MKVENLSFGSISIDSKTYNKDIIIDNGSIDIRNKVASKKYFEQFNHTPLSIEENIPWNCKRLIIGSGFDMKLPVMTEVYSTATIKNIELIIMNTPEAIEHINDPNTNLILHLTC